MVLEIESVVPMGEGEGNDGTSFMDGLPGSVDMTLARVYTKKETPKIY
jgi:hypothetical protein